MRPIIGKLSVTARINAIPIMSLIVLAFVVGMVGMGGARMANLGEDLFERALAFNRQIDNFTLSMERARGMTARVSAEFDLERQQSFKRVFDEALDVARRALAELRRSGSADMIANVDQLAADVDAMEAHAGRIFNFAANFAQDQANEVLATAFLAVETSIADGIRHLRTLADAGNRTSVAALRDGAGSMTTRIFVIGLAAAAASLLLSLLVGRSITRPLDHMRRAMAALANGRTDIVVAGTERGDEIGAMSRTVQVFKDNAIEMQRLQAEKALADEQARADRQRMLDELEKHVGSVVAAGIDGDLSKRVTASFADHTLQRLADGINRFVETVDRGLGENQAAMAALAAGDLTRRAEGSFRGGFKRMQDAIDTTTSKLAEIVAAISGASGEVKNATTDIAAGTEDLSTRTAQAAANLEETAASTEQMAGSVKQNAENAKTAERLTHKANQTATRGGGVAEEAIGAMQRIEESAGKITNIIGVIDEIAFQTNLLALNASVEAARAGESGKGFAVVAQEVRQLAQRSAQAASDIKGLIQDSNGQVEDGVRLVNQAGAALSEIVSSIGEVTDIVRQISSASQEQALSVQEINSSITSMDKMTQQNATLVEQSTAAARALGGQAGKLTELIAFFKLDGTLAGDRRRPSTPRSAGPAKRAVVERPAARPSAMPAAGGEGWDEF